MKVLDFQKPVIGEGFDALPMVEKVGNTVHLSGEFKGPMGIGKLINDPSNPLVIDGHDMATIIGGMSIMDCHNVIFKGIKFIGPVELNDSYPEIGLRGIAFERCSVEYGHPRGVFMGGHNIQDITFTECSFFYTIGGTHVVYMTGGHWRDDYGPVKNIDFRRCVFGYCPAGRNTLQFNGRFDGVRVEDCLFMHAQLNGITAIGVQNGVFKNNISYGHNRGSGIVIYDYASHWAPYYNHFKTQADIDAFQAVHHPCQNIIVDHNTFVVGPKQFSKDAWHYDDPTDGHPAVLINNAVHSGFSFYDPELAKNVTHPGFEYPTKGIHIAHNILHGPSPNLIDIYNAHEAAETDLLYNMGWVTGAGVPCIGKCPKVKTNKGNFIKNPDFEQPPRYGWVNLTTSPHYDFSQHHSDFNAFSWPARVAGVGAPVDYEQVLWTKGGGVEG
jgi:hypothetical protein